MLNRLYNDLKASGVLVNATTNCLVRCEHWQRGRYNYAVLIKADHVLKILGSNAN